MKCAVLSTCSLSQWALDFDGNHRRIKESILQAKEKGARYRLGPELEVTGYSCEDHFFENDTYMHSWESIARLLESDLTDDILCDIGMPVIHNNVRYICRIYLLNRRILLIRPKTRLCDSGMYRESRWFTAWKKINQVESYTLPRFIQALTSQESVPFGDACLALRDVTLGSESYEELASPNNIHSSLYLGGVDIIGNGAASVYEYESLKDRIELIQSATRTNGGIYLYANQQGSDGSRAYFDGSSIISLNGKILAQGSQYSINEVEVITATVNLEDVRTFRLSNNSLPEQASEAAQITKIDVPFELAFYTYPNSPSRRVSLTKPVEVKLLSGAEETGYIPACWLWYYLKRSGMSGFMLPLSGGADSSSVSAIVRIMCEILYQAIENGDETTLQDVRRIAQYGENEVPKSAQEICGRIFFTYYLGTKNNSEGTRRRAENLASEVGATHKYVNIDKLTQSFVDLASDVLGQNPKFKSEGGSATENIALQNIQARSRMVLSYLLAQLTLWANGRPGSLLVLGSGNVDEVLRGYVTKYDCSSSDINPIGGFSKLALKRFMKWAGNKFGWKSLIEVEQAPPSAELEPILENYAQTDEGDMGMTYNDLSYLGQLRMLERCGPVSMFQKMVADFPELKAKEVAEKVKKFFYYYAVNRHKATVMTPGMPAEKFGTEDSRYDHRQFLYNVKWNWQFSIIDKLAAELDEQ